MTLRADHVAGVFFILLGVLVFALSGDLPFGTISSPGAGMLPKMMAGLMMAFAVAIIVTRQNQPARSPRSTGATAGTRCWWC